MKLRRKIALISLINTVILLWLSNYSGSFQASLLISFIFFIGAFWLVKFDVLPIGFTTVLAFPSIIIFIWSFFYFISPFSGVPKFIYLSIFLILNYVLFLNANIINVASIKKIALIQLSQTLSFIIVIATLAILVLALEVVKVGPIIFNSIVCLISFYFSINILQINDLKLKDVILLSGINTFAILFISLSSSLFDITYRVLALVICISLYILLSNEFDRRMKLFNYLEAPILFILLCVTIVLLR